MIGYGNSMFLATHGILARSASGGAVDPDAQAFITAASITDPTQQSAINTLVTDLKGYNIWTKMKALYPFVGGTASTHKWNLKDPRDLDAAFRLVFSGGITHSSTGALANGVNGLANTFLNATTVLTNSNLHLSWYSRTASTVGAFSSEILPSENYNVNSWVTFRVNNKVSGNAYFSAGNDNVAATVSQTQSGFFIGSETASNLRKLYRNGTAIATNTTNDLNALSPAPLNLWGYTTLSYSGNNCAFASIGDGLSDTEATNFYTAVQAFQVSLGRSIGTQTVSDADAQAFVTNAGIVDQVEANAINNLVIGLKADSLWTKMSAIYPMVGGSSSTMKYNLKNPLDTDAAFRLVFNGGWTFSSNGATPNGTNAYADTKFNDSTHFTSNTNGHISAYIRTDFPVGGNFETIIGCSTDNNGTRILTRRGTGLDYLTLTDNFSAQAAGNYSDKLKGQYLLTKDGTNRRYFKNSTLLHTAANGTNGAANRNIYLGAENYPTVSYYSNRELAFATIGDNLTNTDSANLYTRIQNMQTALNRNV